MKKVLSSIVVVLSLLVIAACVEIDVSEVDSISVNWQPEDEYLLDENVDLSSYELTATFINGDEETFSLADEDVAIDNIDVDGDEILLDTSENGPHTISVSYEGLSVSLEYTVFDAIVDGDDLESAHGQPSVDDLNLEEGVSDDDREEVLEDQGAIQGAVDVVPDGGWIRVKSGDYRGATIYKPVTLLGAEDGTATITKRRHPDRSVLEDGSGEDELEYVQEAFALYPGSDGSTIANFTMHNDETGTYKDGLFVRGVMTTVAYGGAVHDVEIRNLTIHNTRQGITNFGGTDWKIRDNSVFGTVANDGGGSGIVVGTYNDSLDDDPDFSALGAVTGNVIENNLIYPTAESEDGTTPAIRLYHFWYNDQDLAPVEGEDGVFDNIIRNNTIIGDGRIPGSTGIEVQLFYNDAAIGDIEDQEGISKEDAITYAIETSMNVVYGNHIVGNTIEDVEIGLNFQNVSETTVQDNTIRDTVAGIHFLDGQRDNQSIENNTFEDNDYSLYDYSVDLKDDDNDIISIPFTRDELDALLANNSFPPGSIVDTEEYDGNEFYVIREDSE